jgi:hypothetical protein
MAAVKVGHQDEVSLLSSTQLKAINAAIAAAARANRVIPLSSPRNLVGLE